MKTRKFTTSIAIAATLFVYTSCSLFNGTGSAHNNKDIICSNYINTTESTLPKRLVQDMVTHYTENQLSHINNAMSFQKKTDAQSITFDLETLKRFIYHLENAAAKDSKYPTSSEKLGIRIYYASYPDQQDWGNTAYGNALQGFVGNSTTEDYAHRHTLVMIPTIKNGNTVMDFDPFVSDSYVSGLNAATDVNAPIFGLMINMPPSSNQSTSSNNGGTNAQNHGGLHPPYDNLGAAFN